MQTGAACFFFEGQTEPCGTSLAVCQEPPGHIPFVASFVPWPRRRTLSFSQQPFFRCWFPVPSGWVHELARMRMFHPYRRLLPHGCHVHMNGTAKTSGLGFSFSQERRKVFVDFGEQIPPTLMATSATIYQASGSKSHRNGSGRLSWLLRLLTPHVVCPGGQHGSNDLFHEL